MLHKQVSMVITVALVFSGVKLDAAAQQLVTYGKQFGPAAVVGFGCGYKVGHDAGFKEGAATAKPAPLALDTTQAASCENGHLVQAAVIPLNAEQVSALAVLSATMLTDDFLAKDERNGGLTPRSKGRALAIKKVAKGDEKKGGMIDETKITSAAGYQVARKNIGKVLGLVPTEEAGHAVRAAIDKGVILNAAKEGAQAALDVDALSSAIAAKVNKGAEGKKAPITKESAIAYLTELQSKPDLVKETDVNAMLKRLAATT
ncbi:MAG TPA: hypothetical protein VFF04_01145 [Candidatus Babeliales bacterium]|nr:hypothetical protein [Candidatus Babeliales bacterium]